MAGRIVRAVMQAIEDGYDASWSYRGLPEAWQPDAHTGGREDRSYHIMRWLTKLPPNLKPTYRKFLDADRTSLWAGSRMERLNCLTSEGDV